ncbi:amidohydrolase family protein [Streptomyces violaceusniger]|uniref:amidohydrolase family protein n=1 Tax=Streptomyces violaceusniger TaxID=68280 RepID=UPI00099781D2|nr:amidohydrolase family protein [Streptomyces hygroscopicus]AQW49988.1 peptidase M38 [Streptomyces hygroscopicus]
MGRSGRSATTTAAALLRMTGQIGTVAPGAYADLLVVDGNPAEDLSALLDPEHRLAGIVARGRVTKKLTGPETSR